MYLSGGRVSDNLTGSPFALRCDQVSVHPRWLLLAPAPTSRAPLVAALSTHLLSLERGPDADLATRTMALLPFTLE